MTGLILDDRLLERLIAERRARGIDRYDEVWDGVYVMTAAPSNQHQWLVSQFLRCLTAALEDDGLARVYDGCNITSNSDNWENDYRIPDLLAVATGSSANDLGAAWSGPVDLVVEITSPRQDVTGKIAFYEKVGVRECLLVDLETRRLTFHRRTRGRFRAVVSPPATLRSGVFPLSFRGIRGESPRTEVCRTDASDRSWVF